MPLRTRIAVTFLLLLAAVLAAALGAVSAANRGNAQREVQRQLGVGTRVFFRVLETNRRQLTQAAQAVAADYGFREAVSIRDNDTLASALENSGARIGAAMVVLTTLDGKVTAASGSHVKAGMAFPVPQLLKNTTDGENDTSVMVEDGRIFQLVSVAVRSPLPVAWIVMGFELDAKAARDLAEITGLAVTLSVKTGNVWTNAVSTAPPGSALPSDLVTRQIPLSSDPDVQVVATLSRSLADAKAPFERLTKVLFLIAGISLVGSGCAAFWLARNITRPLQNLTDAVDHIRAGTYNLPVTVQRRDELGVLAEGLQLMQAAVNTRDRSIRQLAYEDTLTGLMNRTAFGASLSEAVAQPGGRSIAVAVVNLNRFRRINEHLGYSVGDAVLTKVAERLETQPAVAAGVARLAADQFAAYTWLEEGATPQSWGAALLARFADPIVVQAQPIDISATIGLSLAPRDATLADELLRCADLALERARREKRPLAAYEAAFKPVALDQLSLLGELRHAVDHDELRLFFQPKLEFATGRVAGVEVLLRWQHPTRGLLAPAAFVPFAEQTGFIRRLTRWTLDHAIAQGVDWHAAGRPLPIAVNISADDIGDNRFDLRVASALTRRRLPPGLLTLEVTESGFIEDPVRALQMLDALAALGVHLSIDDFGTGYSSLSHLARMPVHEVKIDRSFINGLETDREMAAVVRSAIDMGHSLGLKVVAEGIETEAAAARLREFKCDIAQGYLFAKPMPLEELECWLAGRERMPVVAVPVDFSVEDVTDTVTLAVL
jgi:diguanylate cyclase (GGDEF)-like protein